MSSVFSPLNEDGSGDRDDHSSVSGDVDRRLSLTTQLLLQSSQPVKQIVICYNCRCHHSRHRIV